MTALVPTIVVAPAAAAASRSTVLVFARVDGYHHDSIPAGQRAIPVHLKNVGNLKFRVASSANGGTVEARFGAPDGPLPGSAVVPVSGGGQTWTEVTTPVTDPGSTPELFLVARNSGVAGDLFNVDWCEFQPEV